MTTEIQTLSSIGLPSLKDHGGCAVDSKYIYIAGGVFTADSSANLHTYQYDIEYDNWIDLGALLSTGIHMYDISIGMPSVKMKYWNNWDGAGAKRLIMFGGFIANRPAGNPTYPLSAGYYESCINRKVYYLDLNSDGTVATNAVWTDLGVSLSPTVTSRSIMDGELYLDGTDWYLFYAISKLPSVVNNISDGIVIAKCALTGTNKNTSTSLKTPYLELGFQIGWGVTLITFGSYSFVDSIYFLVSSGSSTYPSNPFISTEYNGALTSQSSKLLKYNIVTNEITVSTISSRYWCNAITGYNDRLAILALDSSPNPATSNIIETPISSLPQTGTFPIMSSNINVTGTIETIAKPVFICDSQSAFVIGGYSCTSTNFYSALFFRNKNYKNTYRVAPPTNILLSINGNNNPVVTWTDMSTDETDFVIERRKSTDTIWERIGRVDSTTSVGTTGIYSFADDGHDGAFTNIGVDTLTDSNIYYYRVKARKVV